MPRKLCDICRLVVHQIVVLFGFACRVRLLTYKAQIELKMTTREVWSCSATTELRRFNRLQHTTWPFSPGLLLKDNRKFSQKEQYFFSILLVCCRASFYASFFLVCIEVTRFLLLLILHGSSDKLTLSNVITFRCRHRLHDFFKLIYFVLLLVELQFYSKKATSVYHNG